MPSKEIRWTIYIIVIIAVIGFGYWLTYTQRPDTYTPHQAPETAPLEEEGPASTNDE